MQLSPVLQLTKRGAAPTDSRWRLTPALTRDDGGRQAAGGVVVKRLVRPHLSDRISEDKEAKANDYGLLPGSRIFGLKPLFQCILKGSARFVAGK